MNDGTPTTPGRVLGQGDVRDDATHRPDMWLFPAPQRRFVLFWQSVTEDAFRTRIINFTHLDEHGNVLDQVRLNDLDRPDLYLPDLDIHSVHFDGQVYGVVHEREFLEHEPAHFAIQWMAINGDSMGRTELGELTGRLVRHPDDDQYRLFVPGAPIRMVSIP